MSFREVGVRQSTDRPRYTLNHQAKGCSGNSHRRDAERQVQSQVDAHQCGCAGNDVERYPPLIQVAADQGRCHEGDKHCLERLAACLMGKEYPEEKPLNEPLSKTD